MLHVLPPSPRLLRRDDPVGRSATRAWGGRLKGQVTGRVAWIDVRFGSEANICAAKRHVRFTPESGHLQRTRPCLLWANSGLMQCKKRGHSITSSARNKSDVGMDIPSA